MNFKALTASVVGLASVVLLSGCASASEPQPSSGFPSEIVIGAIPNENSTDLTGTYEPLIKMIEAETGSKVKLQQASDYAGIVEGMIADRVDIAFLGPFSYVIATANKADIQPLGALTKAKDTPAGYYSLGITQGSNDAVSGIEDFAGKDTCFVDPGSTSGFLYPSAGLISSGVASSGKEADISKALKPIYAGSHDASALSVKSGQCEVGFAMQSMVEDTLPGKGELQAGELKSVWKSEMIPGSVFAVRNKLGDDAVAKLTALFTEKANADYFESQGYCTGKECLITGEHAWGVVKAGDADYDGIRNVCLTTKSEKCEP
ncbi:phosphate starvation-inducible protein PhoH [Arthrobacter sp. MYb23]|uniref:phosphate/phosphite/phosphonate ABC transporter substrate-binding protein n=1 Tax=unclassified Arthrobacter TaxID=235627 RepID=UPI000CFAB883|nr:MULTISPECIES: phosphate/phosphite/phosphonate ABC transporter substrate-binding protein [unclassified Arthrobacter]PRB43414.1 phosphate starvation-inducible protein PhoH [Arthrobacter sp. MYb51]PRB96928.1 phosphate starvation-inducible protein PhoH [Arthrobacter sp. MYb23]